MDENFKRANLMGAATQQKFFFRTNIFDDGEPVITELTLRELFEGNVSSTPQKQLLTHLG